MIHEPLQLKKEARDLRVRQTPAERAMWNTLRGRRFLDLKFRRQQEIGRFIVDFYCEELKLCIELDGAHHFDVAIAESDAKRTTWLQKQGVTLIRIENEEFLLNAGLVMNRIERLISKLRKL